MVFPFDDKPSFVKLNPLDPMVSFDLISDCLWKTECTGKYKCVIRFDEKILTDLMVNVNIMVNINITNYYPLN